MASEQNLNIRTFDKLSAAELYEILRLREAVFIVEQNCPYPEADGTDPEAVHLWYAGEDGRVAAYLRLYQGRVVTSAAVRGTGLGRRLLHEGVVHAAQEMGADRLYLEAQVYAVGFYRKEGFEVTSGEFLEDGIPHVQMRRNKGVEPIKRTDK